MAQDTLERVLEDIRTLETEELREVQKRIEERLARPDAAGETVQRFLQALLDQGIISDIRPLPGASYEEPPLVHIQGKPLSETIIEERR